MIVTDMQHYVDKKGCARDDLPGPMRTIAEFMGRIVSAATVVSACCDRQTALACRRRPGRVKCPGHLRVDLPRGGAEVRWRCSACGDEGMISGWRSSPWDLSQHARAIEERPAFTVRLTDGEYAALLNTLPLLVGYERVAMSARHDGMFAVISGSDTELSTFRTDVAIHADRSRARRQKEFFTRLRDLLEEVSP
jgi:hypothetical protein